MLGDPSCGPVDLQSAESNR